jgi:hypothetical protein
MSVAPDNLGIMENLQETEGMTPLIQSAIRLNEIYKSLLSGGFNEDEALTLIAKMTKPGSQAS